jgi:hypothetical protein
MAFFHVYQDRTVVGIRLPTGWFGKPFDNYYTLTSIEIDHEEGMLGLDLSYGWILSFKPLSAELSESQRELTVDVESGAMVAIGARQRFGAGEVVFCVADSPYASAALSMNGELLEPFIR